VSESEMLLHIAADTEVWRTGMDSWMRADHVVELRDKIVLKRTGTPPKRMLKLPAVEERTFAGIDFCWIPPGEFMMGSPGSEKDRDKDEIQHGVTISQGFWMGKYEVTQAQWQQVMGENPSWHQKGSGFLWLEKETIPNCPVEQVSWNDCQEFIKRLNASSKDTFRLSTEAEWEYACRAGTSTRFYWGDDLSGMQINDYGWYADNSGNKPHPVGEKRPNPWGLYDMSGNVWEWCQDGYGDYPGSAEVDPTGVDSASGRVIRGGSWFNDSQGCRSAFRFSFSPVVRIYDLGFRVLAVPVTGK
ncbi:MAG: formylglycine-generating enzyme family protein, partial [Candidatus Hydrogenedentes bacterium]|nr:formylglycine-generating enzyme family protein [Candidatus Hydrogenedentota bacterium]